MTTIGLNAFSLCSSLTEINVSLNNSFFSSIDSVLFNKDATEILCYPCGITGEYDIPDGVFRIGRSAFLGCKSLTAVTIPDGITDIDVEAFRQCTALTNINIPEGVESISNLTFDECYSLEYITIPASVIEIGIYAFHNCPALTDVYYGSSESDWNRIIIHNNNYGITSATIHFTYNSLSKPTLSAYTFGYTSIRMTWDAVEGADGYEIFRCDRAGQPYNYVDSVSADAGETAYRNIGLSTGTTYYYKVRAYKTLDNGTKLYSDFSAYSSARPIPATPVVTVTADDANNATISWVRIYGATGYSVYRSTEKDGTYSFLAGISSGDTVSYTDKNTDEGVTYYYKVRAYRQMGKDMMFGEYSKPAYVK